MGPKNNAVRDSNSPLVRNQWLIRFLQIDEFVVADLLLIRIVNKGENALQR